MPFVVGGECFLWWSVFSAGCFLLWVFSFGWGGCWFPIGVIYLWFGRWSVSVSECVVVRGRSVVGVIGVKLGSNPMS